MFRKVLSLITVLCFALGLCACGEESGGVPVQRADSLLTAAAGDRYAAMVVSEDVTNIQRDSSKTIAEVYVAVGDDVKAGDKLFSYDFEALELEHEKQQLELEKMKKEQGDYAQQLEKLEKQLSNTYNEADKSRLTLEINSLKTTILENDYQMLAKENSIADLAETLQNVDVLSPVDGKVRSVNEDEYAESYISIQQEGAYRLKGSLNEMNMGSITVGARIRAYSRVDDSLWWDGTVLSINTDEPAQNEGDYWYGGAMDSMTGSSSYVFLAELDSVDGLLLGQHLYVELAPAEAREGLWIPESFIAEFIYDEVTFEQFGSLWVEEGGKLSKRDVTLGEYDYMIGAYEVLAGLDGDDYVADPSYSGCEAGAAVSKREVSDFTGEEQ